MRDAKIDAARCVANYLIVLLHAGGAACQYGVPGSVEYGVGMFLTEGFGNIALAALFLLSGYLLFRNFDVSAWPRKMGSRLVRPCGQFTVLALLFCGPGVAMTIAIHRLLRRWLPWVARIFDGTLGRG